MSFRVILSQEIGPYPSKTHFASRGNPRKSLGKISQKISRKFTTGPENPSKKIPEIWSLEIPQKVPEKSQKCPHISLQEKFRRIQKKIIQIISQKFPKKNGVHSHVLDFYF